MIWNALAVALSVLHLQSSSASVPSLPGPVSSPCHPLDSCDPPRDPDDDHLWGNYTCECGAHCLRHGTCCADSPHAGAPPPARDLRREACQRAPPYFHEYVALVSSCSDRWRHEQRVRNLCERREEARPLASMAPSRRSFEDPLSEAPVTSATTGVSYRNHHCATCNLDDRDVRVWEALLVPGQGEVRDFPNVSRDYLQENLRYRKEVRSWGVQLDAQSFLKLQVVFSVPQDLRKVVKRCHPRIVSDCDASRDSGGLRPRCLSHYSPVRSGRRWYRNVHCAACNGAAENVTCGADVRGRKKPSFSFAHLLDVNGDVARGRSRRRCEARQMWDPFANRCRSLACALPGYVVKNGACVKD